MSKHKFQIFGLLLFTSHITHAYVMLTANVEDVKTLARKFVSEPLAEEIANLLAKATGYNPNDNVSEENEKNVMSYQRTSDNEQDLLEEGRDPETVDKTINSERIKLKRPRQSKTSEPTEITNEDNPNSLTDERNKFKKDTRTDKYEEGKVSKWQTVDPYEVEKGNVPVEDYWKNQNSEKDEQTKETRGKNNGFKQQKQLSKPKDSPKHHPNRLKDVRISDKGNEWRHISKEVNWDEVEESAKEDSRDVEPKQNRNQHQTPKKRRQKHEFSNTNQERDKQWLPVTKKRDDLRVPLKSQFKNRKEQEESVDYPQKEEREIKIKLGKYKPKKRNPMRMEENDQHVQNKPKKSKFAQSRNNPDYTRPASTYGFAEKLGSDERFPTPKYKNENFLRHGSQQIRFNLVSNSPNNDAKNLRASLNTSGLEPSVASAYPNSVNAAVGPTTKLERNEFDQYDIGVSLVSQIGTSGPLILPEISETGTPVEMPVKPGGLPRVQPYANWWNNATTKTEDLKAYIKSWF